MAGACEIVSIWKLTYIHDLLRPGRQRGGPMATLCRVGPRRALITTITTAATTGGFRGDKCSNTTWPLTISVRANRADPATANRPRAGFSSHRRGTSGPRDRSESAGRTPVAGPAGSPHSRFATTPPSVVMAAPSRGRRRHDRPVVAVAPARTRSAVVARVTWEDGSGARSSDAMGSI
jgi:hypothetical protein